MGEQTQNFQNEDEVLKNVVEEKKEMLFAFADTEKKQTDESRQKSSAKKEKEFVTSSAVEKPTIENAKIFFLKNNFPELEANKFFNYFSSNGWLVGGKTPMVDWQAAAKNWMLNANKFNTNEPKTDKAKHLNTTTDKDYSEPL